MYGWSHCQPYRIWGCIEGPHPHLGGLENHGVHIFRPYFFSGSASTRSLTTDSFSISEIPMMAGPRGVVLVLSRDMA